MSPIPDDLALSLHDRLTRGQPLSADEREALEHWYESQDRAEMALLGRSTGAASIDRSQEQLNAVLEMIAKVSARIGEISNENDSIRRENAVLRRRLAQRVPSEAT